MNSLLYDTPELMARYAAPSTMAEEIFNLRERVDKLQSIRAETLSACARASCTQCAKGYTVLKSSDVGQYVHFADLQSKDLPPIYFDQICYATHIWELAESANSTP